MALKKCKECGHEVSSKADKCPNCGAPLKRKPRGCGALILILIAIAVISNLCTHEKSKTTSSPHASKSTVSTPASLPREIVSSSAWDGSVYQVERYLQHNLKDPKSYEAIEWSPVQKVDLSTHKYVVRCKYRAKNSFGGYVIANQIFYLDKEGNVVSVRDVGK